MKLLNTACAVLVEIALLGAVLLAILALFSGLETRHLTVTQTIDTSHAKLSGDTRGLAVGQRIPLYRFNPDWKLPIGEAKIDSISAAGAAISIDPGDMRWPLGRHGALVRGEDNEWTATVGSDLGFHEGDTLNVFRDRQLLGRAAIVEVSKEASRVEITGNIADARDLVVSEYRYMTQGAWQPQWVIALEGIGIALFLCVYAAWYALQRRSPLIALGAILSRVRIPRVFFWAIGAVAIVPFSWFMTKMPLYLLAYVVEWISGRWADAIHLRNAADMIFPYLFALALLLCFGFLLWRRSSPIMALWRFVSYRHPSTRKPTMVRGIFLWALHLVIVYVFALTLVNFLIGDIAAARAIGAHPASVQELADFWKYVIWALTVVGVLIGYGYSVVSILWGRFIRNLDFTLVGWLSNGFCYPFFGVVIWQMAPSFTGPDPIFIGGPLALFALVLGSLLNILYMLSIWNLGTMFDLMTDKGVRTSLFYSAIRHPNYTLEATMFFVTELVGLSSGLSWLGISVYFFLYWVRSEREDNFMWYSNPKYSEYQKATPYKFIPGIY